MVGGFVNTNMLQEDHPAVDGKMPIWCVAFNHVHPQYSNIFASVGSNQVSVYECQPGRGIVPLQVYHDEQDDEEFYTCQWTVCEATGAPLLLLGGRGAPVRGEQRGGKLRVLNCNSQRLEWTGIGHGDSINSISVHTEKASLVVTASKDQSLRLWNIRTHVCVLILFGDGSHTSEVLSVDFHMGGQQIVSGSMDGTVKIWSLAEKQREVAHSFHHDEATALTAYPTSHLVMPSFSSDQIHGGLFVDCVRWLGDLVLSKSTDNRILLWRPTGGQFNGRRNSGHQLLQEFVMESAGWWWIRFGIDQRCTTLACGSTNGRIFVWDPHQATKEAHTVLVRGPGRHLAVRHTAISADGSMLLGCHEDGTIWRYDLPDANAQVKQLQSSGGQAEDYLVDETGAIVLG
ncbi:hypothetical protein WJX72_010041 [[Myrmecia] bisecta]|uniref:Uncharacterized protein n=1 Tax=[Myrmecia] bisecta TaxID=41462 RepID=A0AAW1QGA8_9CHLO